MSAPTKRMTSQKIAVRAALGAEQGFVSAQALHAALRTAGSRIGLATVYRALNELATSGAADTVVAPSGETLFRGCSTSGHHHHLVCQQCGLTVEVHADVVEEWARTSAAEHGFSEVGHVLDIYGLCAECSVSRSSVGDSQPHTVSG